MKKAALLILLFTFIQCSSDSSGENSSSESSGENSASELSADNSSSDSSGENSSSNQVSPSYSCEDVQDALNKVYLSYSEVEAGSLPSPATLDSFLDWPLLFNEKLKENPAYNEIISSVTEFDELINNKPDCLGELE
ncbi:MAG: hypothetical protein EVA29_02345 [Candidatus Actinomarinales bacterium]|nr:MAG: hypothetical protein EVA29_02345 [Candidatus Actinomarinales bacterium]|tara:strand:+ start:1996 stop:2406 length:411 start_codon:yes stop_codon:yes gene_type:complete